MTIGGDGGGVSIESPHSLQLSTARGSLLAMLRALPLTVGSRHHACPLAHRLLDLRRVLRAPVPLQLTANPSCHDQRNYHLGCFFLAGVSSLRHIRRYVLSCRSLLPSGSSTVVSIVITVCRGSRLDGVSHS